MATYNRLFLLYLNEYNYSFEEKFSLLFFNTAALKSTFFKLFFRKEEIESHLMVLRVFLFLALCLGVIPSDDLRLFDVKRMKPGSISCNKKILVYISLIPCT